ncbi:MAG: BofC C-terminal domain-containing protein [Clostridia bacterium]|nr:BofC C-terminal domain-containing protein [Clostridia bacterium]
MKKVTIIILISTSIIIALFLGILIYLKNQTNIAKQENKVTEISEIIEDECTDEYIYDKSLADLKNNKEEKESLDSIATMSRKEEEYILREKNGFIVIYKLDDNNNEVEYEKTNIAIDYLTESDKINIKKGLKIIGKQELNKIIEDFE